MGCGGSRATQVAANSSVPAIVVGSQSTDFNSIARQVKTAWTDVKKIDRLGAKVFAHLLYKYTEFRPLYHIPEAYKTEADLLNAAEVQEAGDQFLELYSDIIARSPTDLENVLREKAKQLYERNIRPGQVKHYGESLVHVIKYELGDAFTPEEKQTWQVYTTRISNGLAEELAKFPRKSIV